MSFQLTFENESAMDAFKERLEAIKRAFRPEGAPPLKLLKKLKLLPCVESACVVLRACVVLALITLCTVALGSAAIY